MHRQTNEGWIKTQQTTKQQKLKTKKVLQMDGMFYKVNTDDRHVIWQSEVFATEEEAKAEMRAKLRTTMRRLFSLEKKVGQLS